MIGISFSICCFVFLLILLIFYFSKKRLPSTNNSLFAALLIINSIGVFIDVGGFISFKYFGIDSLINIIISKVYLVYYITYIFCFMLYIYNVSTNNLNKIFNKAIYLFIIIVAMIFILPIQLYFENNIGYSYGASVNTAYGVVSIFIILMLYYLIKYIKNIGYKKYIPLFALFILTILTLIIQKINPEITILLLSNTIVTYLMYFTIENPDMQMLRELYKNKKIIEKSNEDTSRFLFRITGDLKNPVKEIINTTNDIKTLKTKEEILEANKYINKNANNLDYLINKALNISNVDTQKIKIYESKYNIYNLFQEIVRHAKEEINNKIEFKYTIGTSIPTYLYGDAIKLKQAISSTIRISESFTEEGFINIDVSSLIKYNICRLIITIEDSGKGISIDRINEILSMTSENIHISEEEKNLNILEVKKLINIIGGSLMIKSEEEKGTTVIITIDQKIVPTEETEITKKLENYEQTLYGNKKILLIDDEEEELDQIKKLFEKESVDITTSMLGRDAIEKIRNKNKYDLIILDDELSDINAINILKELQKNKNFKTPVIVMINDNKEKIKLEYLKDGFLDTILKSKLDTEIKRIIKRI